MSDVFDLSDKLADRINAGTYTLGDAFTASGLALAEFDVDEIADRVKIHCIPQSKRIETLSRAKSKNEITIGIGVVKLVGYSDGKVDTSQVDGLVEFCEEIADQIRSYDPPVNSRNAKWLRNEIDPIYDVEALYSAQQFRSIINATYLLTTP